MPVVTENDVTIQYEHLYSALFSDNHCEFYSRNPGKYPKAYSQRHVEEHRKEAEKIFPLFLKIKVTSCNMFPFGFHFLSLLVFIAYRISSRGSLRDIAEALNLDIPFAACLKFVFDNSLTGKISALIGEDRVKPGNLLWKKRAKSIENAAE